MDIVLSSLLLINPTLLDYSTKNLFVYYITNKSSVNKKPILNKMVKINPSVFFYNSEHLAIILFLIYYNILKIAIRKKNYDLCLIG